MIIVTGGAGFIGSNLLFELNRRQINDILVVDDLSDGHKFSNLVDIQFADYLDKNEFRRILTSESKEIANVDYVIHLGACSDTTEWDGKYMLDNNYAYSKDVLHYCLNNDLRLVYASSAAVYGLNRQFEEQPSNEKPLNVYGFSKLMFDQYVRRLTDDSQSNIVGLRYFNVYGPREAHKNKMASVFYHFNRQLNGDERVRLFGASHGCANGGHERDFIYVEDAVDVTLWMADHPEIGGVFNCGTGLPATFNDVAEAVIEYHGKGEIEYIPMPDALRDAYQSYTRAELARLRAAGYDSRFVDVKQGAKRYLDWLTGNT